MSEAKKDPVNRSKMPLNTGSFAHALPLLLFAGLLCDSPQNSAAAEIPGRLPLPQAAAARNSQDDTEPRLSF